MSADSSQGPAGIARHVAEKDADRESKVAGGEDFREMVNSVAISWSPLLLGLWCLVLPASFIRFQKLLVGRYLRPGALPNERVIRTMGAVVIFFTIVELW